jgi:hypothetical protein
MRDDDCGKQGQWRRSMRSSGPGHLPVPADRRLSPGRGCSKRPWSGCGESGDAAHARGCSLGAAQRCAGAGAEVSHVCGCLSCDRRRPWGVVDHCGASADGAGLAVLEHAGAAGRALGGSRLDSSPEPYSNGSDYAQRRYAHRRWAQKRAAVCCAYRRSLICHLAYSIARRGCPVYKAKHR